MPKRPVGPTLLTLDTVVPYLLRLRLVAGRHIVDGRVRIEDVSRRNRAFRVVVEGGRGLLVKQAWDASLDELRRGIACEARLLRAVAEQPLFRRIRWFSPRLVHYDARNLLLATELVHPAASLTKYHLNLGNVQFPEEAAVASARLLADFHQVGSMAAGLGLATFLPRSPPPAWSLLDGVTRTRAGVTAAALSPLTGLVRGMAALGRSVRRLRARWSAAADFVHGDARWDNVLVAPGSGPGGMLNLRLIDWELARRGDSTWDVARFLAEYLCFWLSTMMLDGVDRPKDALARAPFPPSRWHASARSFWETYARLRRLDAAERRAMLARTLDCVPVALGVIAFEYAQGQPAVPGVSRVALGLAEETAEAPAGWAESWLGFPEGG